MTKQKQSKPSDVATSGEGENDTDLMIEELRSPGSRSTSACGGQRTRIAELFSGVVHVRRQPGRSATDET